MICRFMVAALSMTAMAFPVAAQLSGGGGQIQISADKSVVRERDNQAIYSGNVDVIQKDARLRTDELVINFSGNDGGREGGVGGGFGELTTMVATGDVFYITPDLQVRGDKATYDAATDTVTVVDNVVIVRGEDVAKGECLSIEISNGITTLGCGRAVTILSPPERSNDETPSEDE